MSIPRSPLSLVFLLHIGFEAPIAVQGFLAGHNLPFLDMNNTSLIMLKLYATLLLATCVGSLLVFSLPEFLPGKRAFAIVLLAYHSMACAALMQSARFIPHTFGTMAESMKVTPENVWGVAHGILSVGLGLWWQGTLGYARAIKQQ
ncbi:hypothetical protein BU17DRAFT_74825 [Hysterangium stoloniferum]|nr:hypothetical protein BU17DRAFT_74825 [Hysterangium stoloniferum]